MTVQKTAFTNCVGRIGHDPRSHCRLTTTSIVSDLIPYCGFPDNDNEYVPLVTGRGTYLSLWNDEDLYGRYIEEQGAISMFCYDCF